MATSSRESRLYQGYLKNVQELYERQPVLAASLQVILSIFAVAFFSFFAIRPTLSTISTLLKKIEDQRVVDRKLDTKLQQLSTAEQNLTIYGGGLERQLRLAIPNRPEVARLAKLLEAVSIDSQAYIVSLDVQESPLVGDQTKLITTKEGREEDGEFVTLGFVVGGSQEQIRAFLETLERLDRVILITRVAIQEAEASLKGSFPLVAEGRLTVYYLSETNE